MNKYIKYLLAFALGVTSLSSCESLFDNLEGDLSKMTENDMTNSVAGLERLISSSYGSIPNDAFGTLDKNTMNATDTHGASYSISPSSFFNYTTVRGINRTILQIDQALDKGVINKAQRDAMMGEALFIRAYFYFGSVRTLGGVPIVTEPLDDKYDGGENAGLYVPRSTEKETWDFVISELDKAIELLPETRTDGSYRANKYAALGLQSRVALYAASVSKYWKNAALDSKYQAVSKKLTYMEESYADAYYQKCIEASSKLIDSGKFSLYGGPTADRAKAEDNLFNLFLSRQDSEFIFGRSYETGVSSASNGFDFANSPNQNHATSTAWQWGRYSVTLDLADVFDNYDESGKRVDGTIKTREDGVENVYVTQISQPTSSFDPGVNYIKYESLEAPFVNKDARFKAWVIYPGTVFRGDKIIIQGGIIESDNHFVFYNNTPITKNGVTYYGLGADDMSKVSGYYLINDQNAGNWYNTGFGIKKFLGPAPVVYSTNPWYDIRYAEILLNYAEAVAESGRGDAAKAKQYLNDIRHRAAFTDDIDLTVANVLHERRIELSFENDHTYTLHRRREYVNNAGGIQHRKHALVPTLDIRGSEPAYIFVRANVYHNDIDLSPSGLNTNIINYYGGISNYNKNKYEPNPSQE